MPVALSNLSNFRKSIPEINSWLLAALFFCIPIQVAPAYNISALMLILWLIEGDFKQKWIRLRNNSVFWIFQAFFWMFVLSLLWTDDVREGLGMVKRYTFFLLSPIFLTVARREHFNRYISAFLISVAMCVTLAYYNWVRLHLLPGLPAGIMVKKSIGDTAPFVDRIMYAPVLAFAFYLSAHKVITIKGTLFRRGIYCFLMIAIAGNLIFSGGRAGQVAFIALMFFLFIQLFSKRPFVGLLSAIAFTSLFVLAAYTLNSNFKERTDLAIHEVVNFQKMAGDSSMNSSSVGLRVTFWMNSFQIFAEHPILGVGAGDFVPSYARVNERNTPLVGPTINPHNQYLFVMATTGSIGGILLLLSYLPPPLWKRRARGLLDINGALALFFMVISMLESYLWRSNTCLMFIVFSSALYCLNLDEISNQT